MQARVAGHFGEWLQGRLGPDGPLALVTLSCPALAVTARRVCGTGPLSLSQRPVVLGTGQAAALLGALGLAPAGRFALRADMPPGGGAGASTAALVALARAAGGIADADAMAAACLAAEGASDPLMHAAPDAILWAPRAGRCLDVLPAPPMAEIAGGFLGPPERTEAGDLRFPDIADLVAEWRGADAGLPTRAALATESARRTTALRGPAGDPTAALAERLGALGFARAHTGSARALIFPPGNVPCGAEAALSAAGLAGILRFRTGGAA